MRADTWTWTAVTTTGPTPSPRTLHHVVIGTSRLTHLTSLLNVVFCAVRGEVVVFGGGALGMSAVEDTSVYALNTGQNRNAIIFFACLHLTRVLLAETKVWRKVATSGTPPSPRLGHIVTVDATQVLVHGIR